MRGVAGRRVASPFRLPLSVLFLLVACSPTAPSQEGYLPATFVVHDGVRWRIHAAFGTGFLPQNFTLEIGLRNRSSDTLRAKYVGDACPLSRLVAYREGEWNRPAWVEPDTTSCPAVPRRPVLLAPGDSTNAYYWNRAVHGHDILGDSLETGDYRFGARGIPLDSMPDSVFRRGGVGWNPDRAELVAPEPVHLTQAHGW